MTSPGFATKLVTGVAELLAANGVGQWAPTGQWDGTSVWITSTDLPETPDRVLAITPYTASADAGLTDTVQMLQVRARGDRIPGTAVDICDAAYAVLHGRRRTLLGTSPNQVLVVQITWQSAAPLGQDVNGRWGWTTNYSVNVNRAAAGVID